MRGGVTHHQEVRGNRYCQFSSAHQHVVHDHALVRADSLALEAVGYFIKQVARRAQLFLRELRAAIPGHDPLHRRGWAVFD